MKIPSLEEVRTYFIDKKYYNAAKEAVKFWNRYDSIGWVVGKARTPMVRWKSAAANWNENAMEYAGMNAKDNAKPQLPSGYVPDHLRFDAEGDKERRKGKVSANHPSVAHLFDR